MHDTLPNDNTTMDLGQRTERFQLWQNMFNHHHDRVHVIPALLYVVQLAKVCQRKQIVNDESLTSITEVVAMKLAGVVVAKSMLTSPQPDEVTIKSG